MKVWIDQDLCTGDGLCEEISPDVFVGLDDGLFYVKEGDKIYSEENGNVGGAEGVAGHCTEGVSDWCKDADSRTGEAFRDPPIDAIET